MVNIYIHLLEKNLREIKDIPQKLQIQVCYSLIKQEIKTLEQVPENLRASVEALLNAENEGE